MTKFQISRPGAPWDYPTLGFRATADGAILDGTAFTPALTIPPDAYWSVYGGGSAETSIVRYASPSVDYLSPVPETPNGYVLAYDEDANTYTPQNPADLLETEPWSTSLSAAIAAVVDKPSNTMLLLGDSITNQCSEYSGDNPYSPVYNARGYFGWANALIGQKFTLVTPSGAIGEFGESGKRADQLISEGYVDDAVDADAEYAVVLAGTNDIPTRTAANIAADLLAIWRSLTGSGKVVVACTIPPRADPSDTGGMRDTLRDANRLIRTNAAAEPNVVLCDWYAALVDPSTGLADLDYLTDYIHPDAVGATRMAAVLSAVLDQIGKAHDWNSVLPMDAADAKSLMPNPFMTGDSSGGASSTAFYDIGSGSHVKTKVARTDGIAGEWQQLVITAANPLADGAQIQQQTEDVGGAWNIGDTVHGVCEIETDATSWGVRLLDLNLHLHNGLGNATAMQCGGAELAAMTEAIKRPGRLILRTPNVVIPATTGRLQLNVHIYGPGTIRVGRFDVIKH